MGFLISALIKLIIWYIRLMIWLVIALVVMTGWCIAAATGHDWLLGRGRGRYPGSRCPRCR